MPQHEGSGNIIAYFMLKREPDFIEASGFSKSRIKILMLEALAVAETHQVQRIGTALMKTIVRLAYQKASTDQDIEALGLEPYDQRSKDFYNALRLRENFGFIEASSDLWLLSVEAMRQALEAQTQD